ncbi:MAG: GtrA family protein, partial [Microcystis panniformis]
LKLRSRGRFGGLKRRWQFPLARFLRFSLVGLSGVFVDMSILYLLADPSTLAWDETRSKIIAAEVAIINNFLWNDRWTFGDLSTGQNRWQQRLKRFLKFNLICL